MMLPKKGDAIVVQNITGRYGRIHTRMMLDYGTNIAAGATPGKGGQEVEGVPVYNSMAEAVERSGAKSSVIFVPAEFTYAAAEEAFLAGIKLLVIITERVPIRDELKMLELARSHSASIVGPNCPGLIVPSQRVKLGIMPVTAFAPGKIALFSRSGTLTYEIAGALTSKGFGQSVAVGIGGDPINGTTPIEWMDFVQGMDETKAVVVVGEIGGDAEERLAKHIVKSSYTKPTVAYIAGRHAPKEKKMGHAGAIIYGNFGTAESKIEALRSAGVRVAMTPSEVPSLVAQVLKEGGRRG